jgi:hypothetical protein
LNGGSKTLCKDCSKPWLEEHPIACLQCKSPLIQTASRGGPPKYCSESCKSKYYRQNAGRAKPDGNPHTYTRRH